MATLLDENKQWIDSNDTLIVGGKIFVGIHGQNPTLGYPDAPVNLITIYSDRELSIPLVNPQTTDAYGKSTNKIWIPGTKYSIAVWDSDDNQQHIDLNAGNDGLTGNHYNTMALAVADIDLIEIGDVLVLDGRNSKGDGGGATWDAVDATTVTENELDIVTGNASVSLVLRDGYRTNPKALGAFGDNATNDTAVFTYIETLADNDIRLPAGTYIVNGIALTKRYLGPGVIKLDGVIQPNAQGSTRVDGTLYLKKGADIASAGNTVLLADGNYNDITGTTTINGFTTGFANEVRRLHTDAVVTLKHNTAPGAGFSSLWLPGAVDLATTANLELEFLFDGTFWRLTGVLRDLYVPGQHGGDYIKLSDVKTSGTSGGTFTSGAWRTRTLNTEDSDAGNHCTLTSNQFTLQPGTYIIRACAPAFDVNRHKAKLRNITDSADDIIGTTESAAPIGDVQNSSVVMGLISFTSAKTFEIQHQCETTVPTAGFGVQSGFGVSEVYTVVELWKVK